MLPSIPEDLARRFRLRTRNARSSPNQHLDGDGEGLGRAVDVSFVPLRAGAEVAIDPSVDHQVLVTPDVSADTRQLLIDFL